MNQARRVPKKVLFVVTKATWGGAQKYVFDLATNLPQSEFAPEVAYGERGRLSSMLEERGITTHHIPSLSRDVALLSDIMSFFQIVKLLRRERPDIVHLNSSKAAALGALAARLCGIKKTIFTVHGWPFKENRNVLAKFAIYIICWLTVLLANTTVVVSLSDENIGKRMWFAKNKIRYIPLGIHTIFFAPTEDLKKFTQTIAAFEDPEIAQWKRVVTIAELTENKGISYAINAIAELKRRGVDVTYTIIGTGEEVGKLSDLIIQLDVADRVNLANFRENAASFLKAFDIFLLPSIKEGMPYVLLEAATAQLPIIMTDVVDPNFLALSYAQTVIKPGDPNAIADAVENVLKSDHACSGFDSPFESMLEKTIALY